VGGSLLLAQKTAEVDGADAALGFPEAAMQFHPPADFVSQRRVQLDGFELPVQEHRQGQLGMKVFGLAGGAAAVGFAAPPAAFDKSAGEHIAQGSERTNQAPAEIEFWVGGHTYI